MNAIDHDNLVPPEDACPTCGERHVDRLAWIGDDGERVRCSTCGAEYEPGPGNGKGGTP